MGQISDLKKIKNVCNDTASSTSTCMTFVGIPLLIPANDFAIQYILFKIHRFVSKKPNVANVAISGLSIRRAWNS